MASIVELPHQIAAAIGGAFDHGYNFLINCADPVGSTSYNGSQLETTGSVEVLAPVFSTLDSLYTTAAEKVPNLMKPFQSVAIAIAVTFFLIQVVELAMSERMTLDLFIKFFSKLIVGVAAIVFSDDLVQYIIKFGAAFKNVMGAMNIDDLFNAGGSSAYSPGFMKDYLVKYFDSQGAASWIPTAFVLMLTVGLMFVGGVIIAGMIAFFTISNILEIILKGALLPIPLALLSDDGWRGSGGRYIKGFIGVCCQRGILVFMAHITALLMKYTLVKSLDTAINKWQVTEIAAEPMEAIGGFAQTQFNLLIAIAFVLCVGFAGIGAMQKSLQYSNELFGA